jgi:FkbM family methyltransferase
LLHEAQTVVAGKLTMMAEIEKAVALFAGVTNPLPAVLDRLGLRQRPYVLKLRDGTAVELRPRAGDLFGFYEIMLRRDYLASGQRVEEGATVIDVGANVGCFSLLAARLVGPAGRVFAIEPDPATYRQLLRNIELNALQNVTPLRLAVGGERGKVTLHSPPNALFSSVFSSVNGHEVQGIDREVEMTTLQAITDEHRIRRCDFLKLDCEGAEHDIIAKMSATTAERIAQITMEVHKIPGRDGQTLHSNLERLGYRRVSSSGLAAYARATDGAASFASN